MNRHLRGSLLAATVLFAGCDSRTVSPAPAQSGPVPSAPSPTGGTTAGPVASSGTPISVARTSPCDLVFRDEAAALIGLPIEATVPSEFVAQDGSRWLGECLFQRRSADDIAPLDISLGIGGLYLDGFAALKADPTLTSVDALGDEALLRLSDIWGLDAPLGSIFIRYGDAVLSLTLGIVDLQDGVPKLPGDATRQTVILRELAGIALERLAGPATTATTCQLLSASAASGLGGPPLASAEDLDTHDVWGPGCAYVDATGAMQLFVAVSDRATAEPNFATCAVGGEAIQGLGDAAFYTRSCQVVAKFKYMSNPMVIVRFGSTVVTVTMPPPTGSTSTEYESLRAWVAAVARAVLEKLGSVPGATPPPVSGNALVHPCALLSDAEVAGRLGVAIASETEWSAENDENAICYYRRADQLPALSFNLGRSARLVRLFGDHASDSRFIPVGGIGDAAYKSEYGDESDRPLVSLFVRQADTVLELYIGGNGVSSNGLAIAPGDPAAQLALLRELATLILDRASH